MYGDPPVFKALKWPQANIFTEGTSGAHWTMMSNAECYKVPIICQVIHLMEKGLVPNKSYQDFAFDLFEVTHK